MAPLNPHRPVNASWINARKISTYSEIDFDSVASGTIIDTHYNGVTFSAVPTQISNTTPGHVYASSILASDETGKNVVTIIAPPQNAGFDATGGAIQVKFASLQQYVSIDVRPVVGLSDHQPSGVNRPYMNIYGQAIPLLNGKFLPAPHLGTIYSPLSPGVSNFESWQRMAFLSTNATPDIGSIVFSSFNDGTPVSVYAFFDRLTFAHSPPPFYLGFEEG